MPSHTSASSTAAAKNPSDSETLGRLLTIADVAGILRLSHQTVYKLLDDGTLPALKIGSQWRFDPITLKEWIVSQRQEVDPNGTE